MDPYHHAYHSEISPFVTALSAFQARILSFEYQDNATLQKLVQLSQKIQQLPLTSPLMRWLIGLETLLGKVAEWEQSAASFVSLKGEMASLSKFVIRWRKIELESWSMVLDRRTKEARKKTSALWFHLHESVLQAQKDSFWGRTPASWVKPPAVAPELAKSKLDVFKLLDEFCRLSTLGDFALRCELLQAFANYCQVNRDSSALSCTLRNLGSYYEQFAVNCKHTLDRHRAPIQTKLENQVKISSWDDRNYFALKESADKSHRIILRLAKEFDLVLESPVHLVFEQTAKDYVTDEPKVLGQFSLPQSPAVLLELAPLSAAPGTLTPIYRRARELVEHRIANNPDLCENHEIPRELFETIKERLQSLDKDSPVQWKKRALVDLFNEFKSQLQGAPPVPHRLRDFQELFACEWLLEGTSQTSLFAGLFHLNQLRNLVRSPAADRSEDLSQEECNRGVSVGESIMLMILQQRESLLELHQQRQLLECELGVWDRVASASALGAICVFTEEDNAQVQLGLDLVVKGCRDLDFLCKQLVEGHAGLRALQILPGLQEEVGLFQSQRCCAVSEVRGFNTRFRAEIQATLQEVVGISKQVPSCDKLVGKIESLLGKEFAVRTVVAAGTETSDDVCGKFVQACQLMLQPLALAKKNDNQGLRSHHDWMLGCNAQMRSSAFVRDMGELTTRLLVGQVDFATLELKHNLLSLAKLVRSVLDVFYQALLGFHNALCRLQEFVLKLFRSVVERGFCRPPEEEEGAEEGVDENLKDGTGMGEGQGQENVSKEIEDEEQILGLKGEQQQPEDKSDKPKPEQEEEQDGVEMENDFEGGEMHDMEREDEEKEGSEEDEEEDKEELDRDMGDTGEESQTVDEKLWDEKEDEKTEDEKFEDNAPMKGKEQELRAKDEEDKPEDKSKDEEDKAGKKKDDQDEGGEKDEEEDDGFKAEEIEESSGLEKEQEEQEEEEGDDKMPEMEGKVGEDDEQVEPEDFEMPKDAPAEDDEDNGDAGEDAADLNELAEDASGDEDEDENKPEEEDSPEPEESDGRLTLPTQANEENESKENQEVDNDAFLGQGTTSNRNNNNDNESAQDQLPKEQDDNPGISNQTGGTSGGAGGERFRKGGEPDEDKDDDDKELDAEQAKRKDLNPWRDPGDASKEWSRRKKIVETVGEAEDGGEMDENADHQTVEYKKKDEEGEDKFEQALGPRDDDAKDEEERVDMEEEEKPTTTAAAEEDRKRKKKEEEKAAAGAEPMEQEEARKPKQKPQPKQAKRGKFFEDLEESSSEEEEEEAKEVKDREEEAAPGPKAAEPFLLFTRREDQEDEEARERAKLLLMQQEVEIADLAGGEVDSALLSDLALERGRSAWQRAVNETYESAQHLCEQLRLVLEPTTATKLKGDYRTGTRINMRRVIAYIASGYKKDKIWQKRSKPSRRKYHIALAIDDSKSMKPCKDLALAALALITRALTQLEVGEVGVWSFGDDVKKLHDLSKPFSETSGALVSAHFGFDQNSTCIEQGLSTVIDTLTTVSASSGSKINELPRQLVFIISDGRFDTGSRPRIAKLLRVAKERKQLVALIVVEPEEAAESILDVRQVSFKPDGGGVVMNRYLEDYPFPYYIVLRDMQALPDVLADGLKQWFELIVGDTA